MHVFEQHGAVEASVACRFVLRRRSAIGCGSSDACVRAASSSGSVCCLQVRAETKKRKAPAPVIPSRAPPPSAGVGGLFNILLNWSDLVYVAVYVICPRRKGHSLGETTSLPTHPATAATRRGCRELHSDWRQVNFDDNASYRQKEIHDQRDVSQENPIEVEAKKYDLNYIKLEAWEQADWFAVTMKTMCL